MRFSRESQDLAHHEQIHCSYTETAHAEVTNALPLCLQFREAGQGGLCNQAIMLITDGAVEDYEAVFEKYNWPDRKVCLGSAKWKA